jgi:hypothetical protein
MPLEGCSPRELRVTREQGYNNKNTVAKCKENLRHEKV